MNQRNKMRKLFRLHDGDKARVIQAYAESEQRGEVERKSDNLGLSPNNYAARLFADGMKKGWIHE